jgi:hypothetical protein
MNFAVYVHSYENISTQGDVTLKFGVKCHALPPPEPGRLAVLLALTTQASGLRLLQGPGQEPPSRLVQFRRGLLYWLGG